MRGKSSSERQLATQREPARKAESRRALASLACLVHAFLPAAFPRDVGAQAGGPRVQIACPVLEADEEARAAFEARARVELSLPGATPADTLSLECADLRAELRLVAVNGAERKRVLGLPLDETRRVDALLEALWSMAQPGPALEPEPEPEPLSNPPRPVETESPTTPEADRTPTREPLWAGPLLETTALQWSGELPGTLGARLGAQLNLPYGLSVSSALGGALGVDAPEGFSARALDGVLGGDLALAGDSVRLVLGAGFGVALLWVEHAAHTERAIQLSLIPRVRVQARAGRVHVALGPELWLHLRRASIRLDGDEVFASPRVAVALNMAVLLDLR